MKLVAKILAALTFAVFVLSCNKEDNTPFELLNVPETGLLLNSSQPGFQIEYKGKASWSSTNNNVAQVSGSGYIWVMSIGSAIITATGNDGVAHPINVIVSGPEITSFSVPSLINMTADSTTMIEIKNIVPSNATAKDLMVSLSPTDKGIGMYRNNNGEVFVTAYPYAEIGASATVTFTNITGTLKKECKISLPEISNLKVTFDNNVSYLYKGGPSLQMYVSVTPSGLYPIVCGSDNGYLQFTKKNDTSYSVDAVQGSAWSKLKVNCGNKSFEIDFFAVDCDNIGLLPSQTTSGKSAKTGQSLTQSIQNENITVFPGESIRFTFSMDADDWRDCQSPSEVIISALDYSVYGVSEISSTSWINTRNSKKSVEIIKNSSYYGCYNVRALALGSCDFLYKSKGMSEKKGFILDSKIGSLSFCVLEGSTVKALQTKPWSSSGVSFDIPRSSISSTAAYVTCYIKMNRGASFYSPTSVNSLFYLDKTSEFQAVGWGWFDLKKGCTLTDKVINLHATDKDKTDAASDIYGSVTLTIK